MHTITTTNKAAVGLSHRVWLAALVFFFIFTFSFNLYTARDAPDGGGEIDVVAAAANSHSQIPESVFDALLHYASANFTSSGRMTADEVKHIARVLRRCAAPCSFLVFGLTHETLLWNALNRGGRTVFVDESAYLISKLEQKHPSIEAYDVQFTTRVSEFRDLMEYFKGESGKDCRPVQNLLFSDCKLAINELPNHVYDVDWDVILVDGPRGYSGEMPGRMTAIFTAGVLARSKRGGAAETHVFVHEIDRELERICSEEFLCREKMVEKKESLGHFAIGKGLGFCSVSPKSI